MNHSFALVSMIISLILGCCSQSRTKKDTTHVPNSIFVEPAATDESTATAEIIHLRFDKPINGYTVTVDVTPEEAGDYGSAVLTFTKGDISFSTYVDVFYKDGFSLEDIDKSSEETVLPYTPKPKGVMLYSKEPFCFSDVDFDGVEEIVVLNWAGGVHGVDAYYVFEPDGKRREDAPFMELDDHYEFDAAQKTIACKYYEDPETGPFQDIYKRQKNGSFELIKERVPVK